MRRPDIEKWLKELEDPVVCSVVGLRACLAQLITYVVVTEQEDEQEVLRAKVKHLEKKVAELDQAGAEIGWKWHVCNGEKTRPWPGLLCSSCRAYDGKNDFDGHAAFRDLSAKAQALVSVVENEARVLLGTVIADRLNYALREFQGESDEG